MVEIKKNKKLVANRKGFQFSVPIVIKTTIIRMHMPSCYENHISVIHNDKLSGKGKFGTKKKKFEISDFV